MTTEAGFPLDELKEILDYLRDSEVQNVIGLSGHYRRDHILNSMRRLEDWLAAHTDTSG